MSSSDIRAGQRTVRLGLYGQGRVLEKYRAECGFVNGITVVGACADDAGYENLLADCDAVYIQSHPTRHRRHIQIALEAGRHVLCESPVALSDMDCKHLFELAAEKHLVLMDAIKTAYSTAYNRMLLLVKSGKIGMVMSVDATCASLMEPYGSVEELGNRWNARCAWAPAALLVVFDILGTEYANVQKTSFYARGSTDFDIFTRHAFTYPGAVASVKVGKGVKSEGELVVSGTKGYVFVPAPWWKTDYFEVRYENPADNRRYFYQLDGEGIRYELVSFVKSIRSGSADRVISRECSLRISQLIG